MQILSEIYGYLFEIVKRTCVALSDPSIYAEICTFLERIEQSGPSLLCLYSLSELTQEWNKLTHVPIHSLTCARTHTHARMRTRSHSNTLFLFFFPSITHNPQSTPTLYAQMAVAISNVFSTLWWPYWLSALSWHIDNIWRWATICAVKPGVFCRRR